MIDFIKRWGWLVCFIVGGVIVFVLTRGKIKPNFKGEIEAAKADAKAATLEAMMTHAEATATIEREYHATVDAL